jgi:YD repeat-containing protein
MMPRFAAFFLGMSLCALLPGAVRTDDSTSAEGVPSVKGLPAAKAKAALQAAGLVAKFSLGEAAPSSDKELSVYEQDPPAGEIIARGQTVQLKLYAKRSASTVAPAATVPPAATVVPGVIGQSPKDAKSALLAAGLVARFRIGSVARRGEGRNVYAQIPAAGSSVAPGSEVQLTMHAMPDAGLIREARPAGPELVGVLAPPRLGRGAESVNPLSGELTLAGADLILQAGPVRLDVIRSLQTAPFLSGMLGTRWRLNWERFVVREGNEAAIFGMAVPLMFQRDASAGRDHSSDRFRAPGGQMLDFYKDHVVWTAPDGTVETFDDQGRLVERNERNGNTIALRYDPAGNLERIDGPFHTFLRFTSDSSGRLTRIESSTGAAVRYFYGKTSPPPADAERLVTYVYDAAGDLIQINESRSRRDALRVRPEGTRHAARLERRGRGAVRVRRRHQYAAGNRRRRRGHDNAHRLQEPANRGHRSVGSEEPDRTRRAGPALDHEGTHQPSRRG